MLLIWCSLSICIPDSLRLSFDGTDAKWDSDFIKGAGAAENAWVYVDLGADKVSTISKINMKYFNKVYPTKYQTISAA